MAGLSIASIRATTGAIRNFKVGDLVVRLGAECAGAEERFTVKYYQKLLILLALMWGFVGIQRIVVSIIMPAFRADMKFTYTDVGMVVSVTGLVWAFGALLWSALGDRFGRRPVIIACAALASVFSWIPTL